ncbi:tyrosine-type recombinase/integrase [Croceicoccus sp. BE223]|uniref:tyrosine-type recombinase/integrase n=1 Tax=Croceicoccus sp. BE223 TaxID=2817716 RepID=UPI002856DB0D|nr:tyrosine-type recombinase/integrase [Croceicoccus sp. BE223]MDR7101429.1 integrase [Croceicoccus sp. BE223]
MTAGKQKTRAMPGLHIVAKPTKVGPRWYVYAWRGGPCIAKVEGPRPIITRELLDAQYHARQSAHGRTAETIDWLIAEYEASPEYARLKDSTLKDYRLWLTRISARFGSAPVEAFNDWRAKGDVINWRNEWAAQPRTADKAAVMMTTLLNWAVSNGRAKSHAIEGIESLHSADKSEQIWEERHWQAVAAIDDFPAHVLQAIRLASLTGLRLGDLVALDWSQVFEKQITIEKTRKRGGRAVIPIFADLAAFLKQIGRKTGPVLLNSRGKRWTVSGLETVWQRRKPEGFDRTLHDLRGTFVTYLAVKGLTDEQIARIVGWTAQKVAEIRARYVDEARVVVSLVDRLSN